MVDAGTDKQSFRFDIVGVNNHLYSSYVQGSTQFEIYNLFSFTNLVFIDKKFFI